MNILRDLNRGNSVNFGFEIRSKKSEVKRLKSLVDHILRACYESIGAGRLLLAFDEVLTNAYEHGSLSLSKEDKATLSYSQNLEEELISREAKYGERRITVEIDLNSDKCSIKVEDSGEGFEWQKELGNRVSVIALVDTAIDENDPQPPTQMPLNISANNTTYSGRGLLLAHQLVDELIFTENPTCCYLTKYLKPL